MSMQTRFHHKDFIDDLMRNKRLKSLKEQIHYQNIFKKWIQCQRAVATLTLVGLGINISYHVMAFRDLDHYCATHIIEMDKCRQHIQEDRYSIVDTKPFNLLVLLLNLLSILFHCIGQHYQNKWFGMFQNNDKYSSTKVQGFQSKDRNLQFIIELFILLISPIPFTNDYKFRETFVVIEGASKGET